MTIDHLTDAQKEGMEMFFGDGYGEFKAGWGFGIGVDTKRVDLYSPRRLGWVLGSALQGRGTAAESRRHSPHPTHVGIPCSSARHD
jgi:hypothetical protein